MPQKTQVFLVSISEKDQKKFYKTVTSPFSSPTTNYLSLPKWLMQLKQTHAWGFQFNDKNSTLWKKITEGDWFLFHTNGKYAYAGKVFRKISNSLLANKIWKTGKLNSTMELVVFFDKVYPISLGFLKTNRLFGAGPFIPEMHKILFLQADQIKVNRVLEKFVTMEKFLQVSHKTSKHEIKEKIPIIPDDIKEPPAKFHANTVRFIRDTKKSGNLKKLYGNRCQICNFTFRIDDIDEYSEVHHVWPLGEGGTDDYDNMIVLCPNHHAEFDYGVIGFDSNNNENIIDKNERIIAKISFRKGHLLKQVNVRYHRNRMLDKYDS